MILRYFLVFVFSTFQFIIFIIAFMQFLITNIFIGITIILRYLCNFTDLSDSCFSFAERVQPMNF